MLENNRNAVKEGLYTRDAYVRPGGENAYREVIDQIMTDLLPEGALEMIFTGEIIHATWRLRRCGLAEGNLADQTLIDPMEDEVFEKKQRAIDRARAQAHNILRRSLAELRKLQTERATRRELEHQHAESVAVDSQKVSKNILAAAARDVRLEKRMDEADRITVDRLCALPAPSPRPEAA